MVVLLRMILYDCPRMYILGGSHQLPTGLCTTKSHISQGQEI